MAEFASQVISQRINIMDHIKTKCLPLGVPDVTHKAGALAFLYLNLYI